MKRLFYQYLAGEGGTVSVLRINISGLPEGTHQRSLQATAEEVGLDSRFTKDVQIEATLEKTSRQLLLQVETKTGGVFTCDRCLEDFEADHSSTYQVVYVPDTPPPGADVEEVQVLSSEANTIDIGEDVRQFAILSLPQKMLCREDCAGLCPSCGTNLNKDSCQCEKVQIDTPLSGLQKFLKN
ncbi:MAG TPA: hypothetical protein DEP53_12295 [Bacteroidetes bacterium]|nr:hypothetical protein [Bacteroidota bacterium]